MNESAFDIQVFTNDTMREKCVQLAQAALPHQRELTALDEKISATIQAITVSKIKRDFMRAFADDPVRFINQWMASQSRDLEV
jgi:SWI/SNF-related matrix-associated actin-dependent regulator of chromatin subfamily D